jgi:hypothetical protein
MQIAHIVFTDLSKYKSLFTVPRTRGGIVHFVVVVFGAKESETEPRRFVDVFNQLSVLAMAEGNGEVSEEPMKIEGEPERTEDYQKLIEYGLDEKVAAKLDEIYKTGKLAHVDLDERALDALKEFPVDGALNVLGQFLDSNLEHVSNKSAYLCGVMKTYRQKSRAGSSQGTTTPAPAPVKGPDEEKIKQILDRTGYTLDVTTGNI